MLGGPAGDDDEFVPLQKQPGVEMTSSLGCGGLSNTWGAAVIEW